MSSGHGKNTPFPDLAATAKRFDADIDAWWQKHFSFRVWCAWSWKKWGFLTYDEMRKEGDLRTGNPFFQWYAALTPVGIDFLNRGMDNNEMPRPNGNKFSELGPVEFWLQKLGGEVADVVRTRAAGAEL